MGMAHDHHSFLALKTKTYHTVTVQSFEARNGKLRQRLETTGASNV